MHVLWLYMPVLWLYMQANSKQNQILKFAFGMDSKASWIPSVSHTHAGVFALPQSISLLGYADEGQIQEAS